jgi:hypothetical protein
MSGNPDQDKGSSVSTVQIDRLNGAARSVGAMDIAIVQAGSGLGGRLRVVSIRPTRSIRGPLCGKMGSRGSRRIRTGWRVHLVRWLSTNRRESGDGGPQDYLRESELCKARPAGRRFVVVDQSVTTT